MRIDNGLASKDLYSTEFDSSSATSAWAWSSLIALFLLCISAVLAAINCCFGQEEKKTTSNNSNAKSKASSNSAKKSTSNLPLASSTATSKNANSSNQQKISPRGKGKNQSSPAKTCSTRLPKLPKLKARSKKASSQSKSLYPSASKPVKSQNFCAIKSSDTVVKTHESQNSVNSIVATRIEPRKTDEVFESDVISVIPNPDEDVGANQWGP